MISQPDSSNFSKNSAELSIIIKRTETPPSPLCVFLDLVAGHIESHQVGLAGLVSLNGGHIDGAYRAADIQLRLIGLVTESCPMIIVDSIYWGTRTQGLACLTRTLQ